MQITFDIADDELQVFMPEAEEQLKKLEDGLMQLERSVREPMTISSR